ncbi:NAD(P)-dependent dehydrogenase (short-subunit alcohol dehydrogenase family) [Paenibacillus sp. DS2363]|uniref:short chain dehydrogenase n=1 Tax=Paenibacillus TaxID=44249 RepID=UPI00096F874B|nr:MULTISPECIES: short chain dehydrogenase [Paenibacillus]MCP1424252.1 NAD(P)-dependent dehydrogenase (short-subunit alcohol dehydrogenase family) [Paenibacillus xylanexedens]OME95658.1 short chain dehydrogenase [Paenibacillus amylolyticus]
MKRALVIGGNGTLGKAVVAKLRDYSVKVITAGRQSGDVQVDMTSTESITTLFETVRNIDYVIVAAGQTHYAKLEELTPENNMISVQGKLLGQVNIVLIGQHYINDKGSFTLVSGIIQDHPIEQGASSAMVNGAIDSFAKAAAFELPRGIRLNSVSPNLFVESAEKYKDFFIGFNPVPVEKVANTFIQSALGIETAQNFKIY